MIGTIVLGKVMKGVNLAEIFRRLKAMIEDRSWLRAVSVLTV